MRGENTAARGMSTWEKLRAGAEREPAYYEQLYDSHDWFDSDDDFFTAAVLEKGLRWS
jgi:hypothetical protein